MAVYVGQRAKVLRAVAADERLLLVVMIDVIYEILLTSGEVGLVEMDATDGASPVVGVRGRRSQSVRDLCVGGQVEAEVCQVGRFVGAVGAAVVEAWGGCGGGQR